MCLVNGHCFLLFTVETSLLRRFTKNFSKKTFLEEKKSGAGLAVLNTGKTFLKFTWKAFIFNEEQPDDQFGEEIQDLNQRIWHINKSMIDEELMCGLF